MSHDHLSRGVPVQHLPENQDPEVQFMLDEVTGIVTPLAAEEGPPHPPPSDDDDDEKPAKGKKRAAATKAAHPAPSAKEASPSDQGAGE